MNWGITHNRDTAQPAWLDLIHVLLLPTQVHASAGVVPQVCLCVCFGGGGVVACRMLDLSFTHGLAHPDLHLVSWDGQTAAQTALVQRPECCSRLCMGRGGACVRTCMHVGIDAATRELQQVHELLRAMCAWRIWCGIGAASRVLHSCMGC